VKSLGKVLSKTLGSVGTLLDSINIFDKDLEFKLEFSLKNKRRNECQYNKQSNTEHKSK